MTNRAVFEFLGHLAGSPELVRELRSSTKAEVLDRAGRLGFAFPERDFDDSVWGVEAFLAGKLGEPFDLAFSLWETMWGRTYLEYLVANVAGVLTDRDIDQFLETAGGDR